MDARSARVRRFLLVLAPVAVFVLAIGALHRLAGEFRLRNVVAEFGAIAPWRIGVAVGSVTPSVCPLYRA